MNEQYKVKKNFIDLVFPVHKLGIEIDRSELKEQKRSKTIKEQIGSEIIRTNNDKEKFDTFDKISKIQTFSYDSGGKLAEE